MYEEIIVFLHSNQATDLTMKNNLLHVGSLVRIELYRQNQSVAWLANQLGIKRTNCYRILRAQSIHTSLLAQLSTIMKHDFFIDCSIQLKQSAK